jgi:molybdate transport system substrate-binding protein
MGLVLAACGGSEQTVVTISAASSLTELAERLETELETQHPDIDVRLNFGGSAGLVAQIRSGAPVDILLAADELALPADDPLALATAPIATNELVIVTPPESEATIADLGDDELRVAACDPAVPCGRAADVLLAAPELAPLDVQPDSREPNVRLVRQRVLSGEVDVGFVYRTDTFDQELRILELDTTLRTTVTAVQLTDSSASGTIMAALLDDTTVSRLAAEFGFGPP